MSNVDGKHRHLLVGLVGPVGAGKDTIAGLLVGEHGFYRAAFAERLRAFVRATDPAWAIAEAVLGYERAKRDVVGFRQALISAGESAREHINPDVWVDAVDAEVEKMRRVRPVVVTDVRHRNEAEWVDDCGGSLVAVYRPLIEPENDAMAQLMLRADFEISNSSTPEALAGAVAELVGWLED